MEYYVIYDLNDNIITYCDDLTELSSFVNLLKKHLKFRFKNRDFIYYIYGDTYRKIYKFFDESVLVEEN